MYSRTQNIVPLKRTVGVVGRRCVHFGVRWGCENSGGDGVQVSDFISQTLRDGTPQVQKYSLSSLPSTGDVLSVDFFISGFLNIRDSDDTVPRFYTAVYSDV